MATSFCTRYVLFLLISLLNPSPSNALNLKHPDTKSNVLVSRRRLISASSIGVATLFSNNDLIHAAAATPPASLSSPRVQEIGSGFDLLSPPPLRGFDAVYPPSLLGQWQCEKTIIQVDGDKGQAETAWRALGGSGDFETPEQYYTNFIEPPPSDIKSKSSPYIYEYGGDLVQGVIEDKSFTMRSRLRQDTAFVVWEKESPNMLAYENGKGVPVSLNTVQQSVDLPGEKGFGFNALIRITTPAGLVPGNIMRAVRVQRRYRRGYDNDGKRIVDGLELVKTYRVLDGIAGVEFPTSTTKAKITMVMRP